MNSNREAHPGESRQAGQQRIRLPLASPSMILALLTTSMILALLQDLTKTLKAKGDQKENTNIEFGTQSKGNR